jgi:DNA-binding transcriptional MerR regulator
MPELWSVERLADVSGFSGSHIRYLLRKGKVEGSKVGRAWLITEAEAKRFLAERKRELEQKLEQVEGVEL